MSTNTLEMLSRKFFNPVPNRHFGVGILILSTSFVLTTVHNYFPLSGNEAFSGSTSEAPLVTAVSLGFTISSSSKDNVASAILLTHSPLPPPRSLGFSLFKIG